jgi:lipoyl(octanoyl) transferase
MNQDKNKSGKLKCRFIDTGASDAYTNMAIDEAIMNFCDAPSLRVYSWKNPSISMGQNQSAKNEINLARCKEENVDVVRRITGGKAVLHENDITYSFIIPQDMLSMPSDVLESYKVIAHALVIALEKIGISSKIVQQKEKVSNAVCFSSANWYELVVNGKKISGSAQRRMKEAILQHGPVLLDFDAAKNARLFSFSNETELEKELKNRVTSVRHELGKKVSYEEMAETLKYGFGKNFGFDMVDSKLSKEELKEKDRLVREKYSTGQWNFRM